MIHYFFHLTQLIKHVEHIFYSINDINVNFIALFEHIQFDQNNNV